jgi:hypothetical protein
MILSNELFDLEKNFWTGNSDFYRQHLADDCMVVFSEMAGLLSTAVRFNFHVHCSTS